MLLNIYALVPQSTDTHSLARDTRNVQGLPLVPWYRSVRTWFRRNHNKRSKSVPLLMKNQLSYTPFILLPQVYIAFHSTFPKNSDIQLLLFIFYTTLKLLPTWLSQTLQTCERSYFMLKIFAKTPRISLYSSYLHI